MPLLFLESRARFANTGSARKDAKNAKKTQRRGSAPTVVAGCRDDARAGAALFRKTRALFSVFSASLRAEQVFAKRRLRNTGSASRDAETQRRGFRPTGSRHGHDTRASCGCRSSLRSLRLCARSRSSLSAHCAKYWLRAQRRKEEGLRPTVAAGVSSRREGDRQDCESLPRRDFRRAQVESQAWLSFPVVKEGLASARNPEVPELS